ncbi:hypothetical protein I6I07_16135 [Achromobacter deleyi]|uniref:Uncharacterized protein n=1 Tax=Achromobacter deleyi TaxID=1353891 RepID=A0A7T4AYD2_9BURK|nr:DUF6157 family protein [Achromobacter deleyi]QQB32238.1 hypothetical protein I6I07_16135 [Achromobacter deleyi]
MTTNYTEAFITVSPDSTATAGATPTKAGSIAQIQHELLTRQPYHYTSDDLLFEVHVIRQGIAAKDRKPAREAFFAKPQACLRASPLVKQFGWGLHHDADAKVAAYGVGSEDYRELSARADLKIVAGMRSKRAG